MSLKKVALLLAVLAVTTIVIGTGWLKLPACCSIYRSSPPEIESYLLTQTPIGSSKEAVRSWLIGQHAFIQAGGTTNDLDDTEATVAKYSTPFVVIVVARYQFDAQGGLLHVSVTKAASTL